VTHDDPAKLKISSRKRSKNTPQPSLAYLGVALGAMALSLFFQVTGQGKWQLQRAVGAYVANHRPLQQIG
jgi:hypothetical protein